MRLDVHRNGVKLFFITLAVAGRQPVLSRVTREDEMPELLPLGRIAQAALLAINPTWPGVGISDFVIMPDHLHFLLVVDFLRVPDFNPLWATHRLIDAIEAARHAWGPAPVPPAADTVLRAEMVARLKAAVEAGWATAAALRRGEAGVRGLAPVRAGLFERSPWLDLAFDARQLKAIRHYIRLNPARWLWKRAHPDRFACVRGVKAARLARFAPRRVDGLGNLALLGSPFLFHVRLTLKKTLDDHRPAIDDIVDRARRGMVPVSGFISPGEREALRRLKAEPRARFIRLLPYALPDRYDPGAEDSRELAANRLAILSPFPETLPISSRDILREAGASRAFRANCLALNDFAAHLCED